MIKLSISNIAWTAENDEAVYGYLREQGFQGLEIAPTRIFPDNPYAKTKEARQYAKRLKEVYGLEISSMQSIWFGRQEKLFGSKEERNTLLDYTKRAIAFAEAMECKNLVFGSPKNRIITVDETGHPIKEQMELAVEFFTELGEYAAEHNTCLSMEANPAIYQTNFITHTTDAIELAKRVNREGFRVNADLGTVLTNEEKLEDMEGELSWLNHFHISEPGLEPVKRRNIHRQLYEMLAKHQYSHYVSIEMKQTKEMEQVFEALRYIKEIFAGAE